MPKPRRVRHDRPEGGLRRGDDAEEPARADSCGGGFRRRRHRCVGHMRCAWERSDLSAVPRDDPILQHFITSPGPSRFRKSARRKSHRGGRLGSGAGPGERPYGKLADMTRDAQLVRAAVARCLRALASPRRPPAGPELRAGQHPGRRHGRGVRRRRRRCLGGLLESGRASPPERSSACWSTGPRPRRLDDSPPDSVGGSRSATLVALSTPPFGLSYYRLRSTLGLARAVADPAVSVTETLITHNTGVTLVQSLADGIAVGATA